VPKLVFSFFQKGGEIVRLSAVSRTGRRTGFPRSEHCPSNYEACVFSGEEPFSIHDGGRFTRPLPRTDAASMPPDVRRTSLASAGEGFKAEFVRGTRSGRFAIGRCAVEERHQLDDRVREERAL